MNNIVSETMSLKLREHGSQQAVKFILFDNQQTTTSENIIIFLFYIKIAMKRSLQNELKKIFISKNKNLFKREFIFWLDLLQT